MRLPTEKKIKQLIKKQRKSKFNIIETLKIDLCGRIDGSKQAKIGLQNTFWINAKLEDGFITHWHTFGEKHELHNHNVVNAKKQFPVRCVCAVYP